MASPWNDHRLVAAGIAAPLAAAKSPKPRAVTDYQMIPQQLKDSGREFGGVNQQYAGLHRSSGFKSLTARHIE